MSSAGCAWQQSLFSFAQPQPVLGTFPSAYHIYVFMILPPNEEVQLKRVEKSHPNAKKFYQTVRDFFLLDGR
jgi:hypothetical protein